MSSRRIRLAGRQLLLGPWRARTGNGHLGSPVALSTAKRPQRRRSNRQKESRSGSRRQNRTRSRRQAESGRRSRKEEARRSPGGGRPSAGWLAPRGKLAKIPALLKHGGFTLTVTAPATGRLTIAWYHVPKGAHLSTRKPILVARGSVTIGAAHIAKLTVKLTSAG